MSFSKDVKEELSKLNNLANKEEVYYEFLGYLTSNNISEEKNMIKFSTENDYNINRFSKIIRNLNIQDFKIDITGKVFFIKINKKYLKNINEFDYTDKNIEHIKPFMRGVFMGSGSINNPKKSYKLELSIKNQDDVLKIINLMKENDISFKQMDNVIYIIEGEEISKFLAFIGASKSVIKFEEIRVERHMNNKVNRLVNCKTANLNKVLNASIEQVNAIRKLKQEGSFEKLNDNLKEIAELRLEYPDMELSKLGQKLKNPIGKSGVNYRLNKIIKISKNN